MCVYMANCTVISRLYTLALHMYFLHSPSEMFTDTVAVNSRGMAGTGWVVTGQIRGSRWASTAH